MFQRSFSRTGRAWLASLVLMVPMLFMGSLLSGCSRQADSQPIATYPLGQAGAPAQEQPAGSPVRPPIAQYPLPPAVVYHATLVLQVAKVDQAAQQAAAMTGKYGGYLANLQSWQVNGRPITSLDLAVPTNNFDDLRLGLRRLGSLVNETISGEPVDPKPGLPPDYPSYSTITVQLQPAGLAWPALPDSGWNPGHTLQRAFGVFVSIFGFLADILIWIVVVLGPFILIAAAGYWLVRRMRRSA